MFIHLSLLTSLIAPYAGLVAPIAIWQLKKSELPEIDAHGKVVTNWILSMLIYQALAIVFLFGVFLILSLLGGGAALFNPRTFGSSLVLTAILPSFGLFSMFFGLVFILGIFSIIFPIIGAINATNGKLWQYPLSINLLK
jgi:uncharacterized protein